jgi:hypothetical protein
MATVNKNFRIKDGLIVEGTTGTINGYDIFTAANTTDDIAEGTTNLFFTAQRAQDAVSGEIGTMIGDAIALLTTSDIEEGTNLYFTNQRAFDAVETLFQRPMGPGTGINVGSYVGPTGPAEISINRSVVDTWYDAAGAASTAQANANDYTDSAISTAASNYDPAGSAQGAYDNALADANSYTDSAISSASANYDVAGAAGAVASDLSDHINDTSAHGVSGDVVGTSDVQSLSNKTIVGQTYFQSEGGAGGTNNYIDVNNSNGKLRVRSGYALDLIGSNDVTIESTGGDIVLNADGTSYLSSATAGNQIATQGYVDGLASNYDAAGAASQALSDANDYTDTAVSNLVGLAPAALDTLQELAAAFDNSPDTLTNLVTTVGGKQDALTAGTGIDITGATISVVANTYDAYGAASTAEGNANDYTDSAISGLSSVYDALGAASTAESNAKSYADTNFVNVSDLPGQLSDYVPLTEKGQALGVATLDADGYVPASQLNIDVTGDITAAINALTTSDIEEGTNLYFTDARAIDAVSGADIYPNAVIINNVSKSVATSQTVATASTVTALSWAKADFVSAKLLVKAVNATDSQVSEVLITLDSSDNVAITEFGLVYTAAELATITADVSGSDVRVRVTTAGVSTDVTVFGTLLV